MASRVLLPDFSPFLASPFFVALVGLAALEVAGQAPAPTASDRLRQGTARMPVLAQQALQAQGSRRAAR